MNNLIIKQFCKNQECTGNQLIGCSVILTTLWFIFLKL
jgi:hypothetical protein